jgi:proteasome activator subunit 4
MQDRFVKLAGKVQLPDRVSPAYNAAVRQRHAAIIGICALIDSFPYTIEKWMPGLLTTVMLEHTHDPVSKSSFS